MPIARNGIESNRIYRTDDENSNHASSTVPQAQASTGQFGIQQRHTLQPLLDTHVNPMQYMPVASNSMMPPIFPTIPLTMPLPMSQINPTVTPSLSQRQTLTTDHTRVQSQPILANTAIDENRSAITSNLNSISLPNNEKFQETDETAKGLIQSDDTPLESYEERGGRRYCLLAKCYIKDSTCRTPNAQPKAWNYHQMKSDIFECNGNYNAMQKCSTKENLVAVGSGKVVGTFRCGGKQEKCDVIYKSTGSHSSHLRRPGAISRDLNGLILKNLDIKYATSNIINTLRTMEIGQLETLLGNRTESFLHTEAGKETVRKQIKNVICHAKDRRKKTKMLQLKNSTGRPSVRSFHDEPSEHLFPSNTTPCRRISTVVQQVSGNSLQNQQPYARSDNSFVNVQNSHGEIDQISINSSPPAGTMVEQYGGIFVLIPETMVYDLTTEVSESNESNLDSAIIISH